MQNIADNEIFDLIKQEQQRQQNGIELIASENFAQLLSESIDSKLTTYSN